MPKTNYQSILKKRRLRIPRLVKSDTRRKYLTMFTNVFNSYDPSLMISFFRKFCSDDVLFEKRDLSGIEPYMRLQGRDMVELFGAALFYLSPDQVIRMGDIQLVTNFEEKYYEMTTNVTVNGTLVYDIHPPDIANVMNFMKSGTSSEAIALLGLSPSFNSDSDNTGGCPISPPPELINLPSRSPSPALSVESNSLSLDALFPVRFDMTEDSLKPPPLFDSSQIFQLLGNPPDLSKLPLLLSSIPLELIQQMLSTLPNPPPAAFMLLGSLSQNPGSGINPGQNTPAAHPSKMIPDAAPNSLTIPPNIAAMISMMMADPSKTLSEGGLSPGLPPLELGMIKSIIESFPRRPQSEPLHVVGRFTFGLDEHVRIVSMRIEGRHVNISPLQQQDSNIPNLL
jgi:hypothetical protein